MTQTSTDQPAPSPETDATPTADATPAATPPSDSNLFPVRRDLYDDESDLRPPEGILRYQ